MVHMLMLCSPCAKTVSLLKEVYISFHLGCNKDNFGCWNKGYENLVETQHLILVAVEIISSNSDVHFPNSVFGSSEFSYVLIVYGQAFFQFVAHSHKPCSIFIDAVYFVLFQINNKKNTSIAQGAEQRGNSYLSGVHIYREG